MIYPLGAFWDGKGTNFSLFSAGATKVELCLFDQPYGEEEKVRLLMYRTANVWQIYLANIAPGQLYGYRIYGQFEPENGLRYNPHKLLVDPYAKAITKDVIWNESLFGYYHSCEDEDLSFNEIDSAPFAPKSIVVDNQFNWEDDQFKFIENHQTVIYELHVKGFSISNSAVPEKLRGTYLGLAHQSSIDYLKKLGITALELMPIHHFISDHHLEEKGLSNYWGYNTLGFFAPHSAYASSAMPGEAVKEFKQMVKALHQAGIAVILDVVFNHSAEGNHLGPTLCFRGIDNQTYYRLEEQPRYYTDFTGTGNTLNTLSPQTTQLVIDSLRYWVSEMHVDGFRFDLAATLARTKNGIDYNCFLMQAIHQDPMLSQVKLIAEPWDVGENGYQLGNFEPRWSEWNDKFRDDVRAFWNKNTSNGHHFANRILGSPDLFSAKKKSPMASINFITAHDGFTLLDLLSYKEKQNYANGEDNMDGESNNSTFNCGEEGSSADPEVIALRKRQQRNFLLNLFLSQGIPQLTAGDEMGRSQEGNNNAYCQDNEISYLNWQEADQELIDFVSKAISIRNKFPVFGHTTWLSNDEKIEFKWFDVFGNELEQKTDENKNTIALWLADLSEPNSTFYIIFNGSHMSTSFVLPAGNWQLLLSSEPEINPVSIFGKVELPTRCMALLRQGD